MQHLLNTKGDNENGIRYDLSMVNIILIYNNSIDEKLTEIERLEAKTILDEIKTFINKL